MSYLKEMFYHGSASEYLHREDMHLTSGVAARNDLKAAMTSFRSDRQFHLFLVEANASAEKCGSEVKCVPCSFNDSDPTALQNKCCRTLPAHGQNVIDMPNLRCT